MPGVRNEDTLPGSPLPAENPWSGVFEVTNGPVGATYTEIPQTMIEALKSEEIVEKIGGRFKLCALIQRRMVELMDGARPLIDREGRSDLELVIEEILREKIAIDLEQSELPEDFPIGETREILEANGYT